MKYKITESQLKKLVETARIQPWKGNPDQPDISDDQITSWFEDDEETNKKFNRKGEEKIDRLNSLRNCDKVT
jgi:hypothetical protein